MGKGKKKNKNPTGFTKDSKRYCEVCKCDITVGFGGDGNWDREFLSSPYPPMRVLIKFLSSHGSPYPPMGVLILPWESLPSHGSLDRVLILPWEPLHFLHLRCINFSYNFKSSMLQIPIK
ncbi:hypothetical protein BDN72DRAFT_903029 [Pluteus cervinus]|uniref:Uncharacterized protein n=1 Tax=Pluteus cervinus TaxID=181527 RepID=A0ACD3A9Z6_9AGAR|nr:hypothetical protein BDN72DRAFT_903029 [Pluteus cervinus]